MNLEHLRPIWLSPRDDKHPAPPSKNFPKAEQILVLVWQLPLSVQFPWSCG